MFIKELKVEKYCNEDDTYTLVATISGDVNLLTFKEYSESMDYRTMMIPNCLIIRDGRKLVHIYEDGFCILHHFSSIKGGEIFLKNLFNLTSQVERASSNG